MSEEAIQDTGSQEAVAAEPVAAEAAPVSFHETLREDLRSNPSMQKFNDVNGMAQSYINLESMVGADKVAIPGKSATEEQWREVYQRLGAPSDPKDYTFEMPEGVLQDGEFDAFKSVLHDAGLNNNQAQHLAQFMSSTVADAQEAFNAKAEEITFNNTQELQKEFGAAYDQKLGYAHSAAIHLLGSTDLLNTLTLSDGTLLGSHPDVVRMFAKIGEDLGEDNLAGETSDMIMTPSEALNEANKLMLEGPYKERNHPQHQYYVDEVQRLFRLAYPDQGVA